MALIKRNDATEVKDLDAIHRVFPYLMKRRTDSVVFYQIQMDMRRASRYLREKNQGKSKRYYSYFILFIAALVRTIALRPHLNRFIARNIYYQRKDISFSFIVKKELSDTGEERSAYIVFDKGETLDGVAQKVNAFIEECKTAEKVNSDKTLDILLKFPQCVVSGFVSLLRLLDRYGKMPKSLAETDGMHSTIFIANLGSIGTDGAPLHHLYEWGTTSIFVTVGRLRKVLQISSRGEQTVKDVVDISFTVDERISDGFYFIRSLELFKRFIEHPELLDQPYEQ